MCYNNIQEKVRVFDVCRHGTHALGPGLRYVIWTQGCLRRCPGCITPESHSLNGGIEVLVHDLAAEIIQNDLIDGITISGGEPFLQVKGLTLLLKCVLHKRPELTVIIYTGYKYEYLMNDNDSKTLISLCDVLIDGEYIEQQNDNKGIRGSSNQRVFCITNRLERFLNTMINSPRHIQKIAKDSEQFTVIGVPNHF